MREHEHAVPAEEARAVDDVRPSLADERDELGKLLRRVLQVGVLDDHEIAGHFLESAPERGPFAAVGGLQDHLDRQLAREPGQNVPRPVLRAVVDDDELDADGHRKHAADDLLDRRLLVVGRHHDRQQRIAELTLEARHQAFTVA